MSFEIVDHVSGFSDEEVAAMVAEAETGYDLTGRVLEPNPHFRPLPRVPADLLDAIDERAERDGQSVTGSGCARSAVGIPALRLTASR